MEEHEPMTGKLFNPGRPRTNLGAIDFHESYGRMTTRYENRWRELRHWLTSLNNAMGGDLVVYMDPEAEGVKP